MTTEELIIALAQLDTLWSKRESFRTWLAGDTSVNQEYETLVHKIEEALPGMKVIHVHLDFKDTHALIADE